MMRAPRIPRVPAAAPARRAKRRKPRRESLPPTATPLDAVIVALDSARTTGYAIYVRGRLRAFGELDARDAESRRVVLSQAIGWASMSGIPVGVALEVPFGGHYRAAQSLAATAELWRDSWRSLGQLPARCVERTAGDWRRVLFGSGALGREHARHLERMLAERLVVSDMRPTSPVRVGPDAAAAICIGQVIIRARELLAVLGCGCVTSARRG